MLKGAGNNLWEIIIYDTIHYVGRGHRLVSKLYTHYTQKHTYSKNSYIQKVSLLDSFCLNLKIYLDLIDTYSNSKMVLSKLGKKVTQIAIFSDGDWPSWIFVLDLFSESLIAFLKATILLPTKSCHNFLVLPGEPQSIGKLSTYWKL